MRIDSSHPTQNTGDAEQVKRTQQDKTQASATAKTAATVETDSARISPQSLALQKHLQTVKNLPEVRQDKVDAIKLAMVNGTYSVSNQQLGDKMYNDLLKRQG